MLISNCKRNFIKGKENTNGLKKHMYKTENNCDYCIFKNNKDKL